jgi:hypothetical protein
MLRLLKRICDAERCPIRQATFAIVGLELTDLKQRLELLDKLEVAPDVDRRDVACGMASVYSDYAKQHRKAAENVYGEYDPVGYLVFGGDRGVS